MTGLLAGCRILAVEDEMLILMNLEAALGEFGCVAICSAGSVAAALALIAEQTFDAAILDINLGGEKSYPVADALDLLNVPFVFSTGNTDHGVRDDLDDHAVLRKPYSRAALLAAFERMVPNSSLYVAE